ncbi:SAM-dependent methyltransferase [Halobacteriovorax sp. HLS]|uniref:class I SAM-dependent methyltransferase n=1 Tax=Halobacteriovorax sp. HLS TaxID=2234000 RepID=UPI000FDBD634|nr:SAM-dependent methyltransferase [Halobacteriovorax sp. HLS]
MDNAISIITNNLNSENFEKCTFSSPRSKSDELKSLVVYKVQSSQELKVEYRYKKHNDIKTVKKIDFINNELPNFLAGFKQCHLKSSNEDIQILINSKLKSKVVFSTGSTKVSKKHNKTKKYLIPDGVVCPFLIEIGVMDKYGKVKTNYYKKFRQINRFLEMVDDLYKNEEVDSLHAVDFGCGKSYLTFALYHYFENIKKIRIQITGIDLKEEVISHCNEISRKLHFSGLKFVHGFIHDFTTDDDVDFVVTLHACDTATDDAILFSLRNKAQKMMFVPCCQHELNKQLSSRESEVLLKHGIFRERMTSLVTDTMRAQLLEACGYKVQSMEFIDLEHTAKNILLRCNFIDRSGSQREEKLQQYLEFKKEWSISPYLEKCLYEEKFIR